jgi:hypothetical protein
VYVCVCVCVCVCVRARARVLCCVVCVWGDAQTHLQRRHAALEHVLHFVRELILHFGLESTKQKRPQDLPLVQCMAWQCARSCEDTHVRNVRTVVVELVVVVSLVMEASRSRGSGDSRGGSGVCVCVCVCVCLCVCVCVCVW